MQTQHTAVVEGERGYKINILRTALHSPDQKVTLLSLFNKVTRRYLQLGTSAPLSGRGQSQSVFSEAATTSICRMPYLHVMTCRRIAYTLLNRWCRQRTIEALLTNAELTPT